MHNECVELGSSVAVAAHRQLLTFRKYASTSTDVPASALPPQKCLKLETQCVHHLLYAAERAPAWQVHTGQNTVLEDDVVFLHAQEAESVERGAEPRPCPDTDVSSLFRTSCSSATAMADMSIM